MKRVLLCTSIALLSGCAFQAKLPFQREVPTPPAPTLATLQPAVIEPTAATPRSVDIDEVIDSYQALLELAEDPDIRLLALQRLADLRLQKGEAGDEAGQTTQLSLAIAAYEGVLQQYPGRVDNDRVLYQLARTHDVQGNLENNQAILDRLVMVHPDSRYRGEAQFRRGELLFSQGRYEEARTAFQDVVTLGEAVYLANAHYMIGWCEFKLENFDAALDSYVAVLDLVLPEDVQKASVAEQHRTLVEDLLRVMGLAFSYQGGAEAVPSLFTRVGSRPWEYLVYDRYAQLLVEREQFSDAIDVYRVYIDRYPTSLYAPQYQVRIIETLAIGGFLSAIQEEKARFVAVYGLGSEFWNATNPIDLEFTRDRLRDYLPELAAVNYSRAQRADREVASPSRDAAREEGFSRAAAYYRAYAETFPEDPRSPEMLLLLGESLAQLDQWSEAIVPWERAGYDYRDYPKAGEAAYAALLARDRVVSQVGAQEEAQAEHATLADQRHQARLRFVQWHGDDPRAADVLYLAATQRYTDQAYTEVLTLAQQLLDWQPPVPGDRQLEARLLRAHSYFALADYQQAEQAYRLALELMPPQDKRVGAVNENIAASIYRQAEGILATGNKSLAVSELLRVAEVTPDARLRQNAEFDAANYLIELKEWGQAIEVLESWRQRYPKDPLTATIPAKLALAYRETGQYRLAADEISRMGAAGEDEAAQRERLLIAADLYEQAGETGFALERYREYANRYPTPTADFMEAAAKLIDLSTTMADSTGRRDWQQRLVVAFNRTGEERTDRMRYLAALHASELADTQYQAYAGIRLRQPLKQSMAAKTKALKEVMASYQTIVTYGVAEFATLAGFRMGEVYAQLSRDLLESDRPAGLDELALEQYDLLLEEQAYPFEENAIAIHEQNVQRSWEGVYDRWVRSSFEALARLLPARYGKTEDMRDVTDVIL